MNGKEEENEQPDRCPCCGLYTVKEIVELSPAYMWDCPNCGRENFQRSITVALTEEDRIHMNLSSEEIGSWQSYPNFITCKFCKQSFKTRHISETEIVDGDEDEL
jgi:ribosomal protein L37AE/L43A